MTTLTVTPPAGHAGVAIATAVVAAVWFVIAYVLVATGAFALGPGGGAGPLLAGVLVPVAVFLAAWRGVPAFRAFVRSIDLRLLVALQAWRVVGALFLALLATDQLPGLFAWPGGLGDVAVGVTAPFVLAALLRRPEFALGRGFVVWNLAGLFDFVVAFATGVAASGAIAGFAGPVTSEIMGALPFALIPAFIVPIFAMLHIAALLNRRQFADQQG